ncbi:hypothetical protein QUF49_16355 [Fictibacillus sp. b24]|uniref:hypothetical protein n=1 Tax=Fictibacillus sp. b24 TaxID=3055863 RepID=UPI0025A1B211|nr:hypothetical protein [Fictibacillus sp. b24]MDM5317584.1 hypothetical protein [Fictibacillus sp. b24]
MKLNVQYIPLHKIKPNLTIKITEHVKQLRNRMWDCMYMLVVKREKNNDFSIICGNDRYEYLTKHTKNKYALCIIDEQSNETGVKYWFKNLYRAERRKERKEWVRDNMSINSVSIIRAFIREDTRFKELSHFQRLKVILLAVKYKNTVISCMKSKVGDLLKTR